MEKTQIIDLHLEYHGELGLVQVWVELPDLTERQIGGWSAYEEPQWAAEDNLEGNKAYEDDYNYALSLAMEKGYFLE